MSAILDLTDAHAVVLTDQDVEADEVRLVAHSDGGQSEPAPTGFLIEALPLLTALLVGVFTGSWLPMVSRID